MYFAAKRFGCFFLDGRTKLIDRNEERRDEEDHNQDANDNEESTKHAAHVDLRLGRDGRQFWRGSRDDNTARSDAVVERKAHLASGGSVADGAGHVEDDLGDGNGGRFAVHGGEGAEEQIADIGQDGGTARGDLVVGKELVQFAEGMVDAGGGLEMLGLACEGRGEFSEVALFALLIVVFETEARVVVGNGQTAKAATGEAKLTMEQRRDGNDARRFGSHDGSILGRVDTHPGCFRMSGK